MTFRLSLASTARLTTRQTAPVVAQPHIAASVPAYVANEWTGADNAAAARVRMVSAAERLRSLLD